MEHWQAGAGNAGWLAGIERHGVKGKEGKRKKKRRNLPGQKFLALVVSLALGPERVRILRKARARVHSVCLHLVTNRKKIGKYLGTLLVARNEHATLEERGKLLAAEKKENLSTI